MPKQPRMPNMQQMLQQVQKMQQDMEARAGGAQERDRRGLGGRRHGDGEGQRRPGGQVEVKIDPAAVDPEDVEILSDMVLAAVNEALRTAQELARAQARRRDRRPRPGRPRRPRPAGPVSTVEHLLRPARPAAGHRARRSCRASATARRSAWRSTSCAPPTRTRAALAEAIREVKEKIGLCEVCFNLTDEARCRICQDTAARPRR